MVHWMQCKVHGDTVHGSWGCSVWLMGYSAWFLDAAQGSWGCSAWLMEWMAHGNAVMADGMKCIAHGCSAWLIGMQFVAHGDAVLGLCGCSAWLGMQYMVMGM